MMVLNSLGDKIHPCIKGHKPKPFLSAADEFEKKQEKRLNCFHNELNPF